MQGKIVKGIAGFYYVKVAESGIYECKARGIFRKDGTKPLVGDDVEISVINEDEKIGNITDIRERRSSLIRPAVANVDEALVIFAYREPDPNRGLLDRFIIMMEQQNVPVSICFNKSDLDGNDKAREEMEKAYKDAGYRVFPISVSNNEGIDELRKYIKGKTVTVAGPSGVGKSSLINLLQANVVMETGVISEKLHRGKHTTRHAELIPISDDTFICDTPGFSSIYIENIEAGDLWKYYPEFIEYGYSCRYDDCVHVSEPGCMIKEQIEAGNIARSRYDSYVSLYEELKSRRKY